MTALSSPMGSVLSSEAVSSVIDTFSSAVFSSMVIVSVSDVVADSVEAVLSDCDADALFSVADAVDVAFDIDALCMDWAVYAESGASVFSVGESIVCEFDSAGVG